MKTPLLLLCLLSLLQIFSCQSEKTADILYINGNIATVDKENPHAEAIAIKGDRILALGTTGDIQKLAGETTEVIDLENNFVIPGFIEGHGHFSGLGNSLMNLNFLRSKSWSDIVKAVAEKAVVSGEGEWITGRGWHQEKWTESLSRQVLGYPYHDDLSEGSPDNPVVLHHASGHSLFANKKAMELAGITAETPDPSGGEIVRDSRGEAIGVFEERAMTLINNAYREYLATLSEEEIMERWYKSIELAEEECLSKGVTSFQDAGASFDELERYKKLAEEGELDLRLWSMVRHSYEIMKDRLGAFPIINAGNHFFTSRAIKSELDGALGAYGAWLLEPYEDKKGFVGQNTTPISEVERIAELAFEHDLQFCVHTIGDKANQELLNVFEKIFKAHPEKKDWRWRSEHAQHIHPDDIQRFADLGVIAAMQGIHCTSDAPFVVKRLGEKRAKEGAYPWRALLDAGAVVTNGTDAPVEDVDPIESFYATVTRKRVDSGMEFFPAQCMTREEALYSYTLANAFAAFEEKDKGSLEVGKLADMTVLSNDLINCKDEEIMQTEVLMTIVGGEVKFEK
ncbi:MAG: amidohydrolase [Bacteroidetes bacterium]|nr:amidohydrolase [Bacteroidota bacterium]